MDAQILVRDGGTAFPPIARASYEDRTHPAAIDCPVERTEQGTLRHRRRKGYCTTDSNIEATAEIRSVQITDQAAAAGKRSPAPSCGVLVAVESAGKGSTRS